MKRTDITELFPEATKEQIDKLLDLNGADITKAKGDLEAVRGQLATAQTEIDALKARPADDDLTTKLQAVSAELADLKKANSVRAVREKVSQALGVPASLLTAETEEECKQQAEAIKAFAQPQPGGYPYLRDGGEVQPGGSTATRDKFADWMAENFPAK